MRAPPPPFPAGGRLSIIYYSNLCRPAAPGAAGELASELARGQLAPQLQTCRVPSSRAQTTALHRAPEVLIPEANCNLLCNQLMVHRDLTGRSAAWGQLGLQLRS